MEFAGRSFFSGLLSIVATDNISGLFTTIGRIW